MTEPTPFELVLTRTIAVTPDKLFRCWTEPALIVQWFTPRPWTTVSAQTDVRPGGASLVVMRSPDGQEVPNPAVYLDVVPNKLLVATDAYTSAWVPSTKPFMTLVLRFDDLGDGRTQYTARALHWSAADRDQHEKMGFHTGWGLATDQLAELAARL